MEFFLGVWRLVCKSLLWDYNSPNATQDHNKLDCASSTGTLPETNIIRAPENQWLEDGISFWEGPFYRG